ncbi:uncharacterized protein MELLADRAFT_102310 [Melampsora larici-populina 98AG31]|uniref:Uncharacterized protein n=1 Tax=Melampsora larici-populina (strain 98AG31 / pathotype 3-4-7) TaxID=747676 RepID=F4R7V7_MELLP|nr:uncharacterized protein MELLADRAFT_102310 [Melampsora larici-populina 98AG31]EGG11383.1 hypothetical protein MELLADRAFT_102310 [Melampsora larici-populina 98AG31]
MSETRTITTRGQFHNVTDHLRSDGYTSVAVITSEDNCPHQFKLCTRKPATTVPTMASPIFGGIGSVEGELVVHLRRFQVISQVTVSPYSDPLAWKTIVLGKPQTVLANYPPNSIEPLPRHAIPGQTVLHCNLVPSRTII